MECCVEFITLISSEANDISEKEAKKTIACEHVEKALRELGFGDYIPDVLAVAEEHREQLKVCLSFGMLGISRLTWCCLDSPGRRSKARWSKVDFQKRSSFGSNRSSSGLQPRNTMQAQNRVACAQLERCTHAGHGEN